MKLILNILITIIFNCEFIELIIFRYSLHNFHANFYTIIILCNENLSSEKKLLPRFFGHRPTRKENREEMK